MWRNAYNTLNHSHLCWLVQSSWIPLHVKQTNLYIRSFPWFLRQICRHIMITMIQWITYDITKSKVDQHSSPVYCLHALFTFVLTMNQSPTLTGTLKWQIHSADCLSMTVKQYFCTRTHLMSMIDIWQGNGPLTYFCKKLHQVTACYWRFLHWYWDNHTIIWLPQWQQSSMGDILFIWINFNPSMDK